MALGSGTIISVLVIALGAVVYQFVVRDFLLVSFGIGREVLPLSDFPYQCRRLRGPGLTACEDMWLSESRRVLYLACSDSLSRRDWMPNVARFNLSGRPADDKIIAMNIDEPDGSGFAYTKLELPKDYTGINGDRRLHNVGMTGIDHEDHDELFLVNARPSVDPRTGGFLDHASVGGNSTIEQLAIYPGNRSLLLVKTWFHPQIATPNRVAPMIDGSFYFTNDHGPHRAGIRHTLSDMIGSGDVSFCSRTGECKLVSSGHAFPNGLALGNDGLLYVPSAARGSIQAYRPESDGSLTKVGDVTIPMPLDNISPDLDGDLYVAGIPKSFAMMKAFDDPLNAVPPATIWRVHSTGGGEYVVSKALEDRDAEALPGATTAVHDARTGRIFVSGVFSPFVTVCETQETVVT